MPFAFYVKMAMIIKICFIIFQFYFEFDDITLIQL